MTRKLMMAGAVIVTAIAGYFVFGGGDEEGSLGTTFIARRGDLAVTVVEGGNVEALQSQVIRSEIKGHTGVKILRIVEEGYLVTDQDVANGKILVELDSADLIDKMINQEIGSQTAEASYIDKRAQFDIQMNQNQSNITAAELTAKFALMDFQKFLGKSAVDSIVSKLKLNERAKELVAFKAQGGKIVLLPPTRTQRAATALTRGLREGSSWNGNGGERPSRSPDGEAFSRGEGGRQRSPSFRGGDQRPPGGSGRGGFGGEGGGMDPERFRQMMEANGGQMPQQMADRMRQMGMDPDDILNQMGQGPKPGPGVIVTESEVTASDVEPKRAFTIEPEYVLARASINFASYADAESLEDGQAKQMLRRFEDDLLVAKEDLRLAENLLEGQERLRARDFITKNELELERVKVEKARINVASAITEENLYIQYTFQKEAEQLLSDYEEALMNLDRTMREAGAKLSQSEAALKSSQRKYNLEMMQLEDLREQIEKCTIRAELPGLVVYGSSTGSNPFRRSSEEPIQEGTTVRQRQSIITIPDMRNMGVTVNVHESEVQKVLKGQTVTMVIEAYHEIVLKGKVERVAVLADSANMFMNPDLKVYPTIVSIEGIYDWLRPGMSAEVEILIETRKDIVYVPIQALTYFGDRQVCYVLRNGKPERRTVVAGAFTEEFIEIKSGLEEGEEVLLLAPNAGEQDDMEESGGADEGGAAPDNQPQAPAGETT